MAAVEAQIGAEVDLHGGHTHGVALLPSAINYIRQGILAPEQGPVQWPGEGSYQRCADCLKHGIALEATLADQVDELARDLQCQSAGLDGPHLGQEVVRPLLAEDSGLGCLNGHF